jgi:hypothetical protein
LPSVVGCSALGAVQQSQRLAQPSLALTNAQRSQRPLRHQKHGRHPTDQNDRRCGVLCVGVTAGAVLLRRVTCRKRDRSTHGASDLGACVCATHYSECLVCLLAARLLFQDHNEPTLDEMSLAQYADLRSFQLQLNRQFINYRLPLREARGPTPGALTHRGYCNATCRYLQAFLHDGGAVL